MWSVAPTIATSRISKIAQKNMNVIIRLLVFVAYLWFASCDFSGGKKKTHCVLRDKFDHTPPLFQIGDKGKFVAGHTITFLAFANATKNRNYKPKDECVMNIGIKSVLKRTSFELKPPRPNFAPNIAIHQIIFQCVVPARLSFTRLEKFSRNYLVVYLIMTGPCRVNAVDLATLGQVVDIRVLMFFNGVTIDDKVYANDERNGTSLNKLFNVGSLVLHNVNEKTLPRLFLTHVWHKMAEIQISDMSITLKELNLLKRTMPSLQSLELSRNDLSSLPTFPWCNRSLELPRNLSRTSIMNAHYSQGATINPRIYRRFFVVHQNPGINFDVQMPSGRLDKISLRENQLTYINATLFDRVTALKAIDLGCNRLVHVPENVFEKLSELEYINLELNNLTFLGGKIFRNLKSLRKVELRGNFIRTIKNDFLSAEAVELQYISFENNSLNDVEANAFPRGVFDKLKIVNMRLNELREIPQTGLYEENLVKYDVSKNRIDFAGFLKAVDLMSLSDFVYVHTDSGSSIDITTPREATIKSKTKKILNLQDNFVEKFDLTEFNVSRLVKTEFLLRVFTLDLGGNPIHCDCKIRELQMKISTWIKIYHEIAKKDFETWICRTPLKLRGMKILSVPAKELKCEILDPKCPPKCSCYRSDPDLILVDCSLRNLTTLPDILPNGLVELHVEYNQIERVNISQKQENVSALILSHNKLQNVDLTYFSSKLKEVYLDSNKLTALPALFENLNLTKINLRNNFFTCDCENLWMKKWLKEKTKVFVGGAESVACSSGDTNQAKPLVSVEDSHFVCEDDFESSATVKEIVLYVVASFLSGTIILLLVVYAMRKEIKLILYTRFNWHPFDQVEDTDPTKIYDAFVSFNVRDKEWVTNTLQKKLEEQNPPYKLCIHYRDFIPGATIAANILENVKKSRRVIMVLSQHFVESEWCMLEFRAAHRRVLKGRVNFLIIVLFDEVNVDNLDDELKLYLKTNTYLSVNSKWFWERLSYALPQRKSTTMQENHVNVNVSMDDDQV